MRKIITIILIGFVLVSNAQTKGLDNKLSSLPDVIVEKLDKQAGIDPIYKLMIKQPLDHKNHSKGHFYQKVYLRHAGFSRPTVIITEGYERSWNRENELTTLLKANQLAVEHRFFGESLPDSMDYQYLNLEQATADLHRIKELFKEMYPEHWVSTGISKGGATTIFYRYFYPEDVTVSVPYVAPINRVFEDPRIYEFLDQVGSEECRKKIRAFQEEVLKRRAEMLPLAKKYADEKNGQFTYMTFEEAFEYSVMEYPFSFWQYGCDCNAIPESKATSELLAQYLQSISSTLFFSDKDIEDLGAHYYQSAAQMGYYGYETYKFKTLLKVLDTDKNPHATFLPNKQKVAFDGTVLKGVNQWLETAANRMIYIYGAIDTWSATAVPVNEKLNSEWFFMKGKHHGSARIANMTIKEKQRLINTLEQWLEIELE